MTEQSFYKLPNLFRREVKPIPYRFVGFHKGHAFVDGELLKEFFDVAVATRAALCR